MESHVETLARVRSLALAAAASVDRPQFDASLEAPLMAPRTAAALLAFSPPLLEALESLISHLPASPAARPPIARTSPSKPLLAAPPAAPPACYAAGGPGPNRRVAAADATRSPRLPGPAF